MPNPKRRHSVTRRDKRRTHDKLQMPAYYIDQQSGVATLMHRVNLESGYYRGRQVMKGLNDEFEE